MRFWTDLIERLSRSETTPNGNSQIPKLQEIDLANVFAVPDTTAWWRAVLQVIDKGMDVAHTASERASGSDNGMCAYSAAGAQHLRMLKNELVRLREQGLKPRN